MICIAAMLLMVNSNHAQWTTVYQDNNAQFYDAAFPTDNMGYVIASDTGGTVVLRTTDGGTTWNKRYMPGLSFLNKITMIDSLTGYIIKGGAPGKILKTTNGFNSFTTYNIDSSFSVVALSVLSDSTGFFLNNGARLRRFYNNGSSYAHVIDTLLDGQTLQFVNAQTGYLDGGYRLLKTVDAGNSWNYVSNNLGFFCTGFAFADSVHGYFSNDTVIYTTNNGGISFSMPYYFPHAYSFAVNGNKCMAANDTGNVAFTMNGGLTWQNETTGINVIAPAPYKIISTPGEQYFLLGEFCGEIRKRPAIYLEVPTISTEQRVLVYPNPFANQTTLRFHEPQTNTTINIWDLQGRAIKTIYFSGKELIIDRGGMKTGIYILNITNQHNRSITTKIIVQ
jgi:photosystem II stability/assembly factor-like uncharacterized protein